MQIKIIMKYYFIFTRMTKIKTLIRPSVDKDLEQLELPVGV